MCVVGARPNFMKIAPIMRAIAARGPALRGLLVHTGQHYDLAMNEQFFRQLGIPAPDESLDVGSASHAVQTAEIMARFEPVLERHKPDAVLVVGDVNSTIACALVAAKRGIRVVHVEAGLRSWDRRMPEEINRVLTDQISDRLYVTEEGAITNLVREGIDVTRVVFAGNVMIDTLDFHLPEAVPGRETIARQMADATGKSAQTHGCQLDSYGLVTLHRPSNVDDRYALCSLIELFVELGRDLPLVFPMHPRTRAKIDAFGLNGHFERGHLLALPPQGYFEMLGLMKDAAVVLTDSGGVQEETSALGVPCLTLRESTERPVTLEQGTNRLVGVLSADIRRAFHEVLAGDQRCTRRPLLWDGHAAERIIDDLVNWLAGVASPPHTVA